MLRTDLRNSAKLGSATGRVCAMVRFSACIDADENAECGSVATQEENLPHSPEVPDP